MGGDSAGLLLVSHGRRPEASYHCQEDFVINCNCGKKAPPTGGSELGWFTVMRRSAKDYRLPADDAGNVLALTDSSGSVVER
jgi:hypothetical protein